MSQSKTAPLILRNRDMFFLWIGQLLSQSGTKMYQIAILWWVLKSSGDRSGLYLGLVMAAAALPSILFVGWMGRVVDSSSTRRLLVTCDCLSFLVSGAVAAGLYSGHLSLPAVLLSNFLLALIQGFFDPGLNKAVPHIVAPEDIEAGVALEYSTQSIASFGGAVAGALLIDAIGIPAAVLLNALSFLVSAGSNLCVRYRFATPSAGESVTATPAEAAAAPAPMASGWRILNEFPVLKQVLIGFGLVNFFIAPTVVILPLYTDLSLHQTASTLGMLEASLWLGLICGTFSTGLVRSVTSTLRIAAGCIFAVGCCLILPGLVVNRPLFLVALFGVGFSLGINNVRFIAMFQAVVPPAMKGRFFAVMQAVISFTYPVAYLFFGTLARILSPPGLCLMQGLGTLGLTYYFLRLLPHEHELGASLVVTP